MRPNVICAAAYRQMASIGRESVLNRDVVGSIPSLVILKALNKVTSCYFLCAQH